jgi:hypothetical protein
MNRLLLGSAFIALIAPTLTSAAPNPAIRAACHEDTRRLCSSVFGDLEAVRKCMREHHAELSEGCKSAISSSRHTNAMPRHGDAMPRHRDAMSRHGEPLAHWRGKYPQSPSIRNRSHCPPPC